METRLTRINRLKTALTEVREQRDHFSREAYAQIVMVLLEKLRKEQTIPPDRGQQSDEIRLVTVMFVDVKDSTELARQIDTSDWKNIIAEAHNRLAEVVNNWEGQVGQYLGDGMLCFFGAQRSSGDDALQAVSCALEIRSVIGRYAEEVSQQYGIEFAVRTGISTGRLVVGLIGSASKQELLALGPATNLAARLQSIAPPMSVMIDAATYSRVRSYFVTQAQPATRFKGYDEPLRYYSVLERRITSGTHLSEDTIGGIEIPFVGRDADVALIEQQIDRALAAGRFRMVTIGGDAGIGKSRLLQEIIDRDGSRRCRTLVLVAHYEKRTTSHNLLRSLLASQCHLTEDMPQETVEWRIQQYITSTWPHPDAPAAAAIIGFLADYGFAADPRVQPLRLGRREQEQLAFGWVSRWLRGLAADAPLLLVVDNLQWADAASIQLLRHLAHTFSGEAGVLLAAGRPIFQEQYPDYLGTLTDQHTYLHLERLTPAATADLIASVLADVQRLPQDLIEVLSERAEGSPLFVREFLGMLFDNGVFERVDERRWRFNLVRYDRGFTSLPQGLVGVIQARLDDLTPEARHVVQVAAVVGQTFWQGAVHEITGEEVSPVLELLTARGIITPQAESSFDGEGQYVFRHTLYRDVAYAMLPRVRREEYHRQVAQWMVTRVSEKADHLAVLVEHFEQAGQYDAALATCLEAVQNRMGRGLLSQALELIDRGLSLARTVPREVALPIVTRLWTIRGQILNVISRYEEASAASQTALMLLNELPEDQFVDMRVMAARMLGMSYRSMGRYTEAFVALNDAYEFLPQDDIPQLASVLRSFGSLCRYQGRLGDSLAYQQRAYTLAQRLEEPQHVTATLTELGLIALDRGDLSSALRYFEQVLEINYERSYVHYQIADLINIGLVYQALLVHDRALAVFNEAQELQDSFGMEDFTLQAYRGLMMIALGRVSEGRGLLEEAARHGHRDVYNARQLQLTCMEGLSLCGDYEGCREEGERFLAEIGDQNPILYARGQRLYGEALHQLGDPEAQRLLESALADELEYGGRDAWKCYYALHRAAADPVAARDYLEKAAHVLQALGASLYSRPDLQHAFIHHPTVREIIHATEGTAGSAL